MKTNIDEALQRQNFFEEMKREQANYVVSSTAPTIAEYFEEIKTQEDNDYKNMVFDFLGELQNAENKMKIQQVIERYKKIIDDYNERIAKVERGDKDIVMLEGSNIERTKELIKPMELMCRFIDNLLYGNYTLEQIQQYFSIWREKGSINILAPSDYTVSTSGRHAKITYKKKNEEKKKKKDNGAR